jgi:hypothetical protein
MLRRFTAYEPEEDDTAVDPNPPLATDPGPVATLPGPPVAVGPNPDEVGEGLYEVDPHIPGM